MTNNINVNTPLGLSIARWTTPEQGSVIVDSNTYLADDGSIYLQDNAGIVGNGPIQVNNLDLKSLTGFIVSLLPNGNQTQKYNIVLPDSAGSLNQTFAITKVFNGPDFTTITLGFADSSSTGGTVTSVTAGTGLTGGSITTSGTISLANTAVTPGNYTNVNITVDQQGRITAASSGGDGTGTVTSVNAISSPGITITGGPITTSGTLSFTLSSELQALAAFNNTGIVTRVAANTYTSRAITAGSNISVSNGDGGMGNPTIALNNSLSGLSVVSSAALTASGTVSGGSVTASGTVSGGTIVSKGDITAASDIFAARLNILTENNLLTLEGNIAQAGNMTLIFPADTGLANQILQTDGFGNLDWTYVGTGTVTSINTGTGLTGGSITTSGTISLANTAVTPGNYTNANITVDQQGRITAAQNSFVSTGNAATVGSGTLNGTAGVVINTTAVSANSIINVTRNFGANTPSSVTNIGNLMVGQVINNTSFSVYSTVANDVGTFNWSIINP